MKSAHRVLRKSLRGAIALAFLAAAAFAATPDNPKHPYKISGTFVEGCSCQIVCSCNMGHMSHACQGVGAMAFQTGSYMGTDLSGAKMAYALSPGNWVRVYTEAKSPAQEKALGAFISAALGPFGKVEEVKSAKIDLKGADGKYALQVDGGKIMSLSTEPVLGADGKKPFTYHNTLMPLSPTILQAKTIQGSFNDGGHSFKLADSNSDFNPSAMASGTL
jgi:hypothetical protein